MSLTVHLALVFHILIAVVVMFMVCGRHGISLAVHSPLRSDLFRITFSPQRWDRLQDYL